VTRNGISWSKHNDNRPAGENITQDLIAEGECEYLLPVHCDSSRDKATFDDLQIVWFLTKNPDNSLECRVISTDIGSVGIRFKISEAIISHKTLPHQDLSCKQAEINRLPSHNHILVKHFFEQWKMPFISSFTPFALIMIDWSSFITVKHPFNYNSRLVIFEIPSKVLLEFRPCLKGKLFLS
jgi:hypothetical protein